MPKKQQYQFPVPATGVRADIDALVQDQSMANIGKNAIYFDGTIRPRPALTKEIYDSSNLKINPEFDLILDGADPVDDYGAMCEMDNGDLLVTKVQTFVRSVDQGKSWTATPPSHPYAIDATTAIVWMDQIGDYLYAIDSGGDLWRTALGSWPTVSWTQFSVGAKLRGIRDRYIYDEDSDGILIVSDDGVFTWSPFVSAILDISGTPSVQDVFSSTSTPAAYNLGDFKRPLCNDSSTYGQPGNWINKEWLMWIQYDSTAALPVWQLQALPLSWNSVSGQYDITLTGGFEYQLASPLQSSNDTDIGWNDTATTALHISDPLDVGDRAGDFIIAGMHADEDSKIKKYRLDRAGIEDDTPISVNVIDGLDGHYKVADVDNAGPKLLIVVKNWGEDDDEFPRLVASTDSGKSWMVFSRGTMSEGGVYGDREDWLIKIKGSSDNHYLFGNYELPAGVNHQDYYVMPTSKGANPLGDITTIFQADMSDEDNVIFAGGTTGIGRLDRTTNTWTRITATDDESVGTTPWTGSTHVPPLSGTDDSGVNISGTYGEHPWVFRTFEAQGETFLIGVNGQCDPIIYHPDMVGGFARRVGYVPDTDPNYAALADSPAGDAPPRAKCLVSAANRMVFANNPAGSPYELHVSDFNDPDRGWLQGNDNQHVLLGDTAGEIVTMAEISALQFAIYKEDAIYHGISQVTFGFGDSAVAAPFRFELAKAGVSGPCSPASVLRNFDGRQIYLARDGGVYMYDGVAPIDGGRNIRRLIQGGINLDQLGRCWGMVDHGRKMIWFFYPAKNGIVNQGIIISTDQGFPWPTWPVSMPDGWNFTSGLQARLEDDITIGEVDRFSSYGEETLSSFSSGSTEMLMGLQNGTFFSQRWEENEQGYSDDGTPILFHLRTGWLTPGQLELFTADTVYHNFWCSERNQELDVTMRAQQIGMNIRTRGPRKLSFGKVRRSTKHRVTGVQFALDLKGAITHLFRWGGAIMLAARRGNR